MGVTHLPKHEAFERPNRAESLLTRSTEAPVLLAGSPAGLSALPGLLKAATDAALAARPKAPLPLGLAGDVMGAAAADLGEAALPDLGMGAVAALELLGRVLVEHGVDLAHPRTAAHLQPPPLAVAVAADALASATNASLDTYDSGPSAIAIERWLVGALARLAGFGFKADGVLTPGGSLSNLLGLLLAREAAARRRGVDARRGGVAALQDPMVFCSEAAHFSVHRACAALGLGESATITIPTDERHRMRPEALADHLARLGPDQTPIAIVATAGTTDFGSIDPLPELAALAAAYGVWFHVDAAYGFGALFSEHLAPRLRGLQRASSITLDLHKIGWQPAAASVLLVTDGAAFEALDREVAYLNPRDDAAFGLDGLLGRSLQTTRRPDAVKAVATMLAHGRQGLGEMVDVCHELALHAQRHIVGEPSLELVSPAELTTVVFRYRPASGERMSPELDDELNGALRRRLLATGAALIGRTAVRIPGDGTEPRVCLKLTLLNPTATPGDVDALLWSVVQAGRDVERQLWERLT
jgi:L-2,4-diaminobutyrate decarboxylase